MCLGDMGCMVLCVGDGRCTCVSRQGGMTGWPHSQPSIMQCLHYCMPAAADMYRNHSHAKTGPPTLRARLLSHLCQELFLKNAICVQQPLHSLTVTSVFTHNTYEVHSTLVMYRSVCMGYSCNNMHIPCSQCPAVVG